MGRVEIVSHLVLSTLIEVVNVDCTSCAEHKFDTEFWKVVINHLSSSVCGVHVFTLVT